MCIRDSNNTVAACIDHVAEILLDKIGFRGRIIGFDDFFADDGFDGADKTGFKTGVFQDGANHISCGCFPFCTGNTDGV